MVQMHKSIYLSCYDKLLHACPYAGKAYVRTGCVDSQLQICTCVLRVLGLACGLTGQGSMHEIQRLLIESHRRQKCHIF